MGWEIKMALKTVFQKRCALVSPEKSKEIVNRICETQTLKSCQPVIQGEQQIVLDVLPTCTVNTSSAHSGARNNGTTSRFRLMENVCNLGQLLGQ